MSAAQPLLLFHRSTARVSTIRCLESIDAAGSGGSASTPGAGAAAPDGAVYDGSGAACGSPPTSAGQPGGNEGHGRAVCERRRQNVPVALEEGVAQLAPANDIDPARDTSWSANVRLTVSSSK
ncbi:hypothetical protein [Streptomyces bicolor]|uniref:hypothetical protein n=1 Tax=Streptomyces bicolor TaxID=66874 RepID=UPI00131CB5DF|nr:hypothetical protein [Streptomyces bicolor]